MKRVAPTSRGSAFYPRKRAVVACQVCRLRRTKCDRGEGERTSCSYCASIGAECLSEPAAQSAFDPASIAILDRLNAIEQKLDTERPTPLTARHDRVASFTTRQESSSTSSAHQREDVKGLLPPNLDAILEWDIFQRFGDALPPSPLHSSPLPEPGVQNTAAPDPSMYPRLVDDFFSHVHNKNPVLDEAETRNLLRRLSLEGYSNETQSCLALLIYANGALARPLESPPLTRHDPAWGFAQYFYRAAQKRLGTVMDSADVLSAQCFLLAGVFTMSCLRPFDAWRYFSQGLAICKCFPFLNPGARQRPHRPTDTPAAESIYWSCWKSEHELRIELGLSNDQNPSSSYPQLFPSLPDGLEGETLRAWYFYLSEISLWRLEIDAQSEMQQCIRHERETPAVYERLASVAASNLEQLSVWRAGLPQAMNLDDVDKDILNFVLRGRISFIHELLTWPFIYAAVHGEIAPQAWLKRGLESHLECLRINRAGFYHRHHGTWLTIRSSARSACVLVACACAAPRCKALLGDYLWEDAVKATIEMLRFWSNEADGFLETAELLDRMLTRQAQGAG